MTTLDEDLRTADPARHLDDGRAETIAIRTWDHVRAMTPPSRQRRGRLVVPLALTVVALSPGAALVAPIWLGVGEDATRVDPDA